MKNMYRALIDAAYGLFHNESQAISFSRRSRRSLRWLSLHTRTGQKQNK